MNIAVLGAGFVGWGGGVEFLRVCLAGLSEKKEVSGFNLFVLIPEDTIVSQVKRILGPYRRAIPNLLRGRAFNFLKRPVFPKEILLEAFRSVCPNAEIVFYKNTDNGLLKCLAKIEATVVLPTAYPLGRDFPYPWIGYIYDFQHKYHPEYFTDKAVLSRDTHFNKILSEADAVIVNSKAVKTDIDLFLPNHKARVFNLPFCPLANQKYTLGNNNVILKYNLTEKYFVISNQFWIHKAHNLAFEALSILHKRLGNSNVCIACTGQLYEPRFPDYVGKLLESVSRLNLVNKVYFLGYVSKSDQISLIRKSIALIQPTLFEGGPGGGAVYDAVAYGVPSIVSDIPINLEIQDDTVTFFKSGSSQDLADKMFLALNQKHEIISPSDLLLKSKCQVSALGDVLCRAISLAIESRPKTG